VLGIVVDEFQAAGTLMALSELNLRYKGPLRTGDTFYATAAVHQVRQGLGLMFLDLGFRA
jgi:acyl dehydratase